MTSVPTSTPYSKRTPSPSSCATRRSMYHFSSLKSGTPKRSRPPGVSSRSSTTTSWPARASCWAAARPAGPEPTTATLRPSGARRVRRDPALLPRALDDRQLDLLDRDGVVVDGQHAGRLARRRADQPGELGEVVRRVQLVDRVAPAALVDQVVPVRDQVAERAAVVAERDAALHAAGALARGLVLRQDLEDLAVVVDARARIPLRGGHARDLQEGPELAHGTRKGSGSSPPRPRAHRPPRCARPGSRRGSASPPRAG